MEEKNKPPGESTLGLSIALGAGFGMIMGLVFGEMIFGDSGTGLAMGMVFGASFGVVFGIMPKDKRP